MLKERFTDLLKKNGFYVLAAVCVIALAAAIGIVSTNTSDTKDDMSQNAAGFTDADTKDFSENTGETGNEVAANSGLDYTEEYNADEIQEIITQIEESKANETEAAEDATVANASANLNAFDDTQKLTWPVYGSVLLDYSMKTTTYFKTLDQYKCNPGLLIASDINTEVHCAYSGTVESVKADAEHGMYVVINMGNDYRAIYGQLKDVNLAEGDTVPTGALIGTIAQPTKYFVEEGSHLYFEVTKDETPVDPKLYLQ